MILKILLVGGSKYGGYKKYIWVKKVYDPTKQESYRDQSVTLYENILIKNLDVKLYSGVPPLRLKRALGGRNEANIFL